MKGFIKGIGIGLAISMIGLALFVGVFWFKGDLRKNNSEESISAESQDINNPMESEEDMEDASAPNEQIEDAEEEIPEIEPVTLAFGGDVMFSDPFLQAYDRNGISAIADEDMLEQMRSADLFIMNEEFPFSLRGKPMEDKQFTFRTDPKYVQIFKDLGTDIVTVANNHALDFGQDAFCDTLETLKEADISYMGGGYNITEASAPVVKTVNGQTFAFFGATRVSPAVSWYATDSQPGLFQTYDPERLNVAIKEADALYDHVIVFVHWGIERNVTPEDYQRNLAKGYIQAGADLIVGCHPHVLQGFEYYDGVPIIYSLGNYLFGNRDGETLLLQTVFSPEGEVDIQLIPCKRRSGVLRRIEQPAALYQNLTDLSFGVTVTEDGKLMRTE